MREKTINIYKFSELSEKAQEKAIQWFQGGVYDHDWFESTYEDANNIGLKITSFDTERRDIDGAFTQDAVDVANAIIKDHGDTCDTYIDAVNFLKERKAIMEPTDEDVEDYDNLMDEYETACEEIDAEFEHTILEDYLSILRKEAEYLESREYAVEGIEANEYEFNEEGSIA